MQQTPQVQDVKKYAVDEFGNQLLQSISISDEKLNTLFAALLLTSVGVFFGGNLLLLDASVFLRILPIALTCFTLICIYYGITKVFRSLIWGLVLTYGLMWVLVYSRWAWLVPVTYVFGLAGFLCALRFLRIRRSEIGAVLLMGLFASIVILGCDRPYTSFDILERLHSGNVHQDTLMHASIAAMIKNYGITSTGLHGLIETPYHVLSHTLMASISMLSGAGIFEVYGVASWVLFAPILIFSIVASSAILDTRGQLSIPLMWILTCTLLAVSPWLFGHWAVWNSFFTSESYLVSLALLVFGVALLFKRPLGLPDLFLAVILVILISNAKGSVGLIYTGLWMLRVVFLRGQKPFLEWSIFVLVATFAYWTLFDSASVSAPNKITPLDFIGQHSVLGEYIYSGNKDIESTGTGLWRSVGLAVVAVLGFFLFHFLFSWVVIARSGFKCGLKALLQTPIALYSLGAAAAGALAVILFKLPGGAVYYISNIAFFVSLPSVVLILALWIESYPFKNKMNNKRAAQVTGLVSFFSVVALGIVSIRQTIADYQKTTSQHSQLIDGLIELRSKLPLNVFLRMPAVVDSNNPITNCAAQPFLFPAVSERPWTGVITPKADCFYNYYGYAQYGITPLQQTVVVPIKLLPGMAEVLWPVAPIKN